MKTAKNIGNSNIYMCVMGNFLLLFPMSLSWGGLLLVWFGSLLQRFSDIGT